MEGRDGIHDGIWDRIHDRTHGSSPHLGNVHGEPAPGGPDEPLDAFGPAQQQLGPLQVIAALGPERGLRQLPPPQLQELQLLLGWERGARPARGSGCPHPPHRPPPSPSCTFSSGFGSRLGIPWGRWLFGRGPAGSTGLDQERWDDGVGKNHWECPTWGPAPDKFPGPPNPTLTPLVPPSSSSSSSSSFSSSSGPASLKAASSIPEMLGSDGISAPWMGGKPGKGGNPGGNGRFLVPLSSPTTG